MLYYRFYIYFYTLINENTMLINIELPNGITVKVQSEWWYALSDHEVERFFTLQRTSFDYHQEIMDPFDNSVILLETIPEEDFEYLEDIIDTSIDYIPED